MEPHDGQGATGPADQDQPSDSLALPAAPVAEPTPAAAKPTAPAVGNESVAGALAELASVGERPLAEHPDAFGRVHSGLQQVLSDIDDA